MEEIQDCKVNEIWDEEYSIFDEEIVTIFNKLKHTPIEGESIDLMVEKNGDKMHVNFKCDSIQNN